MGRTVWFPGHMAKGRRQLEALAKNLDLIIEVRDARAPSLTSSPLIRLFAGSIKTAVVLSKADLADEKISRLWVAELRKQGLLAWALDLRKGGVPQLKKSLLAFKPQHRDLHLAVVGVPNVGKSMLINQLAGRRSVPVGGIPGVTKGVSWIKGDGFLLVDSPGILDPHGDAGAQRIISWIGASRGEVIGSMSEHAKQCAEFLISHGLWAPVESAWGVSAEGNGSEIVDKIGRRLGKLVAGGEVDCEAAGKAMLNALAAGKFGRMSFEKPGDAPLWESLK